MNVRLLPIAENEAFRAARWYERRQRGLGFEFLECLSRTLELIENNPHECRPYRAVKGDRAFHFVPVERFPYLLILECVPETIWVLAVTHQSRRPAYWKRRLKP